MCEVCRDPVLDEESREPLSPEEDEPFLCEWPLDGDRGLCGEPAAWAVAFNMVESHVCDAHRAKEAEEREGGLGDLLRSTGLETGAVAVAIHRVAKCEWTDPLDPGPACGKPAHWAIVVAAECYYCDGHLKSYEGEERAAKSRA